tara:strand:- start:213 stop:2441 length:2229 start_codon:yes stop_codon:yes gene_type:complete
MAATSMGRLVMTLASNDTEFRKGLRKTLQHAERSMARASAKFGRLGRQMTLSLTAPLAALGVASVKAFATQEKAERKLAAALKASGQEVDANLKRFKEQAAAIQQVTTVGDEMSIGLATTATAMGITADRLNQTVQGAIGLSKAFNMDLTMSIKAASAALQGKTELLTRYIPTLSQIEGDAEKVAFVMDKMGQGFAVAKAEAGTTEGRLIQMKNAVGDLMESIGSRLAPTITKFAERLSKMAVTLQNVNPALLDMGIQLGIALALAGPLTLALGGVLKVLSMIAAVKLAALATSLVAITVAAGGLMAVMQDTDLSTKNATKSGLTFGKIMGKVMGFVANVVHGVRIGFNVMTLGILKGVQLIAKGWTGLGNMIGKVFTFAVNVVLAAMELVMNFIRTKINPLVNETMRQASMAAAFFGIGEPGAGPAPLSTRRIKLDRVEHESKTNAFAEALQPELDARGDRIAELMLNFPGKKIADELAGVGEAMDENLDPEKVEPANDAAMQLGETVADVTSNLSQAGKASGKMANNIEENAGIAVRALTGVAKAAEDIRLGVADAAKSQSTLREQTEGFTNTFADRMTSMLTGASDEFKSFGDVAKSVLQDIASEMVRGGIKDLLGGLFGGGGGGGGGGLLSGLFQGIGSLFGGGRATGGRVLGGNAYLVGERGPELFSPDRGGMVLPNSRINEVGGGGGTSVVVNQTFESGMDEARLGQLARTIKDDTTEGILDAVQRGGGFRAAVQA